VNANLDLPQPSADAQRQSEALKNQISDEIVRQGGHISFAQYMELALYAPGLGYYSGGAQKLGSAGDFVTAPEISPLFARALASQVAQIQAVSAPEILELGAGSGRLAVDLLLALDRLGQPPRQYRILEVSAELIERQRATIAREAPQYISQVSWLDALPEELHGVIIANEVLDAMPIELLIKSADGSWMERGVGYETQNRNFCWADRPASPALIQALQATIPWHESLAVGYVVELNRRAAAQTASLAERLRRGAALFLDYGFPASEYYHAERRHGTLMAHYRHRNHTDPFFWPGLQDLTAHVNFTDIAQAAFDCGAEILGYTSQAHFLMNCEIASLLVGAPDQPELWSRQSHALQTLISEAEMGELFKVIAWGRDVHIPLMGFARGDRLNKL
jgi:SAM-dependent MidA family methyltransferase